METTYGWAPILKFEKNDDGTMFVTGKVSDSALDRDEQVCDQAWLDRAVPAWFGEGGNVREQHDGKRAVGVAVEHWKADDGGHFVRALVADPVAVTKVEHKVLRGFSIGIKNARVSKSASARNGAIVDGQIIEVSLVDRPANPGCLLELAKSDESGEIAPVAPEDQTLVETEEKVETEPGWREQLHEVLSHVGEKADSTTDIGGAQAAIASIAALIQSEADGLAMGDLSEASDISLLLEAVCALKWYMVSEAAEDMQPGDAITISLADTEEQPETDAAPEETDKADDTPLSEDPSNLTDDTADKADGLDIEAIISKALDTARSEFEERLAKVSESHEESLKVLRDELAKANSLPAPGGPVRVRTGSDKAAAEQHDRNQMLAKADEYEQRAATETDQRTRLGYLDLARDLRTKAH